VPWVHYYIVVVFIITVIIIIIFIYRQQAHLRFASQKLLVIMARFDGPLGDSSVLKHVVVVHYLRQPKNAHKSKTVYNRSIHYQLAAAL